jgi:short-subunit dehydrogenase
MSDARLAGRVVAITGASAGIGRATAEHLASVGARVVVSARRADRLASAVEDIERRGGTAVAVPGDVAVDHDMTALVRRTVETFGRLDVMICNAGIGYHGPLDETSPEAMRRLLDVNVLGTFHAARAALVEMRRQGFGHIIAVSSVAGRRGIAGSSVYSATKAAQIGFIEGLRSEFVGSRLHASIVYPVATATEFHEAMARDFGHQGGGRGPRQSAAVVARAIARCIARPHAVVYPYPLGWVLSLVSVATPGLADRLVKRFGRRRRIAPPDAHGPDPA